MIALHMGGIPELAMVLGPILLIVAFVRIARRNEATAAEEDDWDADLGDLGDLGDSADRPGAGEQARRQAGDHVQEQVSGSSPRRRGRF